MKKLLVIVILLLIAVLMVLTVPEKRVHRQAMMAIVEEFVADEAEAKVGNNLLSNLSAGVVTKAVDIALSTKLKEHNYFLFNTTYVRLKGEEQVLSVGLLGKVFTFDKEMLRDKLSEVSMHADALGEPEEVAEE